MVLVSWRQYIFAARARPPRTTDHVKMQDNPNSSPALFGSWHGPRPHWYHRPSGFRGLGVSDESLFWFHATTQSKLRFAGALFFVGGDMTEGSDAKSFDRKRLRETTSQKKRIPPSDLTVCS